MMPSGYNPDYSFSFNPPYEPDRGPFLGDQILLHKFLHPEGIIPCKSSPCPEIETRNRLPKRLRPLDFPEVGFPQGWGVEFVEGFKWNVLFLWESFILLLGTLVPILWCLCRRGPDRSQDAFTIGSWIFGAGQLVYVMAMAASEIASFLKC